MPRILEEIEKILGMRVMRNRQNHTIFVDQEQYLKSVLDWFGVTTARRRDKKIPSADYQSLRPASIEDKRINGTEYQQGIGSLMFAMALTRPDSAFIIGRLLQSTSDPAEDHGHASKEVFRYLRSTVTQKLRYGPGWVSEYFVIFSDADWASDKNWP